MRREPRWSEEPEPKPDLTPMIDIVFNLIIFFLLVSQLSNLSIEELSLSPAYQAKHEGPIPVGERVLPINILADGRVKVRGQAFAVDPRPGAEAPLAEFLRIEAAGQDADTMAITIRADRDARFRHVQGVLAACIAAGLTRTRFAADPTPAGDRR